MLDKVKEFLIGRMLKKGATAAVVAFGASKVYSILAAHGVSITIDPDAAAAALAGLGAMALNWIKNRK